jgi:DNA-binding CsgD family transcriptional regulator
MALDSRAARSVMVLLAGGMHAREARPSSRRVRVRTTPRQSQILDLAAADLSDKEIAASLGLSISTIRTHLERFYGANAVHGRTGAVALWLRSGRGVR